MVSTGLDEDTLARATLTFCLNAPEPMMEAFVRGAGGPVEALELLREKDGEATDRRLEQTFVAGCTSWGKRLSAEGLRSFRLAAERWRGRLAELPSRDAASLADWFTCGGMQWLIGPQHPCWPARLADLSERTDWAPPLCLWGLGQPEALTCCARPVAVVGSRGGNDYGRQVAHEIAGRIAEAGHTVVSGGAMGADAAAHWGALSAMPSITDGATVPMTTRNAAVATDAAADGPASDAGRTVAVFAGGLNHIGPSCNARLFEAIVASGGALISELCPATIPEAHRFLARNRIIAALSSAVVVVQARLRSGALNTANWACELGREVYAVPGNITQPANAGCNKLIWEGKATILPSPTAPDLLPSFCHHPISSSPKGVC